MVEFLSGSNTDHIKYSAENPTDHFYYQKLPLFIHLCSNIKNIKLEIQDALYH